MFDMSRGTRKPVFEGSDTNRLAESLKKDRSLKFRIKKEEGVFYL